MAFQLKCLCISGKYPDKNKWKNAYKFANDAMERKMKSNLKKEGIPKTSSKNNEEENNVKRGNVIV